MPAINGSRTRSIIGRAWQPSTTLSAAAVMPRCASAATVTAAPCAPSPTACCRWPAPCSNSRRCSTPATRFAMPPVREHPPPIPLFDRKPPSLRPDLPPGRAPRAAAVKDAAANAAASAEPAQRVLDRASTVLPLSWEAPPDKGVSRGYCPLFSLDHWWEVRFLRQPVCLTGPSAATGTKDRFRRECEPGRDQRTGHAGLQPPGLRLFSLTGIDAVPPFGKAKTLNEKMPGPGLDTL